MNRKAIQIALTALGITSVVVVAFLLATRLADPGTPIGSSVQPVRVVGFAPAHVRGRAYYGPEVTLGGPDHGTWTFGIDGWCVPQAVAAVGRDVPMLTSIDRFKDGSVHAVVTRGEEIATLCHGLRRDLPE
jgi:hypothetical protein